MEVQRAAYALHFLSGCSEITDGEGHARLPLQKIHAMGQPSCLSSMRPCTFGHPLALRDTAKAAYKGQAC